MTDSRDLIQSNNLERQLVELGEVFPYPPTPNFTAVGLARSARPALRRGRQRLVLVLALILLGLFVVSIPPVRAAVVEFLQLGRIRIYLDSGQFSEPTEVEPSGSNPGLMPSGTDTPGALNHIIGFSLLGGEQTVAGARNKFPYPSPLPRYPANLGFPDRAYLQDLGGPVVIFIWESPGKRNQVKLSLMIMAPNTFAGKGAPQLISETTVNGARALWLEGSHLLILEAAGEIQPVNLTVNGNVLIWDAGDLTYRLEGFYTLDEMVRIAESLE